MALFSPSPSHLPTLPAKLSSRTHFAQKPSLSFISKRSLCLLAAKASDNETGVVSSVATIVEEEKVEKEEVSPAKTEQKLEKEEDSIGSNGAASSVLKPVPGFQDPRWVAGTWDLKQFKKDGQTNWDAVIDAGEILRWVLLVSFPFFFFVLILCF
uniref:Uncharacterized protein n=1 Tax=Nelumbo nucifera TaxID=4432 RepID=A0A822ZWC9_NELNU|nr:TPA_asm: hypothetical protein HUJ06_017572 [Nelumbo nucifera]